MTERTSNFFASKLAAAHRTALPEFAAGHGLTAEVRIVSLLDGRVQGFM